VLCEIHVTHSSFTKERFDFVVEDLFAYHDYEGLLYAETSAEFRKTSRGICPEFGKYALEIILTAI
jgi:hypothetical protein